MHPSHHHARPHCGKTAASAQTIFSQDTQPTQWDRNPQGKLLDCACTCMCMHVHASMCGACVVHVWCMCDPCMYVCVCMHVCMCVHACMYVCACLLSSCSLYKGWYFIRAGCITIIYILILVSCYLQPHQS